MDQINYQIERICRDEINKIPQPTIVTITKIYSDGYVDVDSDLGILRHIYTITEHEIGDKTILIFTNGDYDQGMVI